MRCGCRLYPPFFFLRRAIYIWDIGKRGLPNKGVKKLFLSTLPKMGPTRPIWAQCCQKWFLWWFRRYFGDFCRFWNFSDFCPPPHPPPTYLNYLDEFSENGQKWSILGPKMGGIEILWFRASTVCAKCFMLLEMLFEVEKSENFVKIGPKTAEIQVFDARNRGVIR